MNSNYENEFVNDVYKRAQSEADSGKKTVQGKSGTSKMLLVISIVASIAAIVELVVLLVVVSNIPKASNDISEEANEEALESEYIDYNDSPSFLYDENYKLIGMSVQCVLENKGSFVFDKNGEFTRYNASSEQIDSGGYEVMNNTAVILTGQNEDSNVVYYDGTNIIDGLDFYECEQLL